MVEEGAGEGQGGGKAGVGPAASAGVQGELGLQLGAGEGLVGTAAHVGLALLDDAAVAQRGADVAGEGTRVEVGRIDAVADLGGE